MRWRLSGNTDTAAASLQGQTDGGRAQRSLNPVRPAGGRPANSEEAMADGRIEVKVTLAWWVAPYLRAVELFSRLRGAPPDFCVVERTVLRGVRVVPNGRKSWLTRWR